MARRDTHTRPPQGRDRPKTWSTKLAAAVLLGGAALVFTRAALATVIQIHGDGMAPTILDGESVVMMRGSWRIESGDLVVYDPSPPPPPYFEDPGDRLWSPEDDRLASPRGTGEGRRAIDPARGSQGELHNTAVVEVEQVETNWARVRDRGRAAPRSFRVGRVLAVPGDTVTFHVVDAALGLSINGRRLTQKLDDPIRLVLAGKPAPGEEAREVSSPRLRALAWESLGDSRYPVLMTTVAPHWEGMALPEDLGPIEVRAEGYLILADNRDEGACCDSRALGWIPKAKLWGELVLRLAGDPGASPDSDPRSRGLAWLP